MSASPLLQVLVGGVLQGGVYFVMSLGLTLIYGVMRLVNFAHGALLMLGMYLAFTGLALLQWPPAVVAVGVIASMAGVGIALYFAGFQQTLRAGRPHSAQIVATFGLAVFLEALSLTIWGQDFRSLSSAVAFATWSVGTLRIPIFSLGVSLVGVCLAVGLTLFLRLSLTGKMIQAVSQDREAAAVVGIPVERIYVITLAVGSGAVGVAALLMLPLYYVYPAVSHQFNLLAFLTVVVGGMGSITGALIGGLTIAVVETLGSYFLSPLAGTGTIYALFVLILFLRPGGLLGIAEAAQLGE